MTAEKRQKMTPVEVALDKLPPGLREFAIRRQAARDAGEPVPEEINEEELAIARAASEAAWKASGL